MSKLLLSVLGFAVIVSGVFLVIKPSEQPNPVAVTDSAVEEVIEADANQAEPIQEEVTIASTTPPEEPIVEEVVIEPPVVVVADKAPIVESGIKTITLAGGCFWCTESYLQETEGVLNAVSGYAGGQATDAFYKEVITGTTGHREAVQVTYDSGTVSTRDILDAYWSHINPTDAGGQFADRGFQYTTAIFYHTDVQKQIALDSKADLVASDLFDDPIVTAILPYTTFFEAEEYHQDYYLKSAERYKRYHTGSGREGFVDENWAKQAALEFLESEGQ